MTTDAAPPATPPAARWRRATSAPALGVALLAVVALCSALVWWFQPWAEVGEPGEVAVLTDLPGGPSAPVAREVPVGTPDGGLTVRVGRPSSGLDRSDLETDGVVGIPGAVTAGEDPAEVRRAPRTWDYLPLAWGPYADLDLGLRETGSGPPLTTVSVLDGDEVLVGPFDLGDRLTDPGAVAVLVEDPAEVTLRVSFDGHTQVVHPATGRVDAGVAEAYYDEPAESGDGATGCRLGDDLPPGLALGADEQVCPGATVEAGPWAPGAGWVPEAGQRWVSVDAEVLLATATERGGDGRRTRYDVTGGPPQVTLDGRGPDAGGARRPRYAQPGATVRAARWLVDADDPLDLQVTVPLRLVPVDGSGDPVTGEVTATQALAAGG